MPETRDIRLKRLRIRSWRRGMREMDLLLGPFADDALAGFDEAGLAAYEELLEVNDQELYAWICGTGTADPAHADLVGRITAFHKIG